MNEPLVHSQLTDCLPEDHPLAYQRIDCDSCGCLLHASNNENMQTWVELQHRTGNYCFKCMANLDGIEIMEI